MSNLRTVAQQALEVLEDWESPVALPAIVALRAALAEPALQTCNCRWDGEMQMQQCTLHEAHVDAIKEWAQRAKFAEKKLAALAEPVQKPVTRLFGTLPVYDTPPQRKPLTEEEIDALEWAPSYGNPMTLREGLQLFARAIEQAHGIKP